MSWMNIIMLTTVKATKHKSGPFEHAVSISKWPTGSVYVGNTIYYLKYPLAPFLRGLEIDLEGSNIFPILTLSMLINRLGLFCQL